MKTRDLLAFYAALAVFVATLVAGCGSTTQTVTQHAVAPPGHMLKPAPSREGNPAAGLCGVERWSVKVMSDPAAADVNPTPKDTTIAQLDLLAAPPNPTDRVQGVETTMYRLTDVTAVAFKQEADSDIHIALSDGAGHTMIAEIPSPACMQGASPSVISAVSATRAHFIARFGQPTDRYQPINKQISLQGVGFFDRIHGQRGVAPNGIELHPVVADP